MEKSTGEVYSRSEKSLSALTKKFVGMLQASEVLDLNVACMAMDVSKKRRIYDITNVLEGINLIKKVGKNLYSWTGRNDNDPVDKEEATELRNETKRLEDEEQILNEAIISTRRNFAVLQNNKSWGYLNKHDFVTAFGEDSSALVLKNFRNIKFNFESCFRSCRDVQVTGDVVRPVQLRLVNMAAIQSSDLNRLICLDDMESDENKKTSTTAVPKKHRQYPERSQNLNLFRRRQKLKKFLDLEEHEREKLAVNALEIDRFKDKSMFNFILENQLVTPDDYENPAFISLEQPIDAEYEDNYSIEAPSVHDLFDIRIDRLDVHYNNDDDYEMLEYIEEDEDL